MGVLWGVVEEQILTDISISPRTLRDELHLSIRLCAECRILQMDLRP